MKNIIMALSFLLTGALALGGCGSDSSTPTIAANAAYSSKSWADVSVASSNQAVTLSWTDNANTTNSTAITYNVYVSFTSGVKTISGNRIAQNLDSTTFTHSGLDKTKTYYYVITAVSATGVEGAASREVSATPQAAIPAAPQNISIQAGDGQVTIALPDAANALPGTTFNLYWWGNGSGSPDSPIVNTNAFLSKYSYTFKHTALNNGQTYSYQVTSVYNNIESSRSTTITATPQKNSDLAAVQPVFANLSTLSSPTSWGQPSIPANLAVVAGNQQATISWALSSSPTSPNKATNGKDSVPANYDTIRVGNGQIYYVTNAPISYKVCWATNAPFANKNNATCIPVSASPFTHTALSNGTTYYYSVSAVATYNNPPYLKTYESAILTQVSVVPHAYNPPAPTNLAASVANQEVDLSWKMDTSGGAVTYNIYYATSSPSFPSLPQITGITGKSYAHTGIPSGLTIYYYITATSQDGKESAASAVVSATP
jgi:fibronectin type 3 domain-containing protein